MDMRFAPGCFGSALTYKAGTKVCDGCVFAAQCQPQSEARLAHIRAMFGVKPKEKAAPRIAKPKAPAEYVETAPRRGLSVRATELVNKIKADGVAIETLLAGENPFAASRLGFMKVICHLLLGMPGGIDRPLLCSALERKLNWSHATAVSHASQAAQALVEFGVATEIDGKLQIARG